MKKLEQGERFPTVEAPYVGGGSLTIPDDMTGEHNVILLYRGHW